ncbi:DNA ligase [Aliivibrio finisterrensis]|uniref:DNA ligase n=1 Tax=Aliivibrio finisterrensis TaxID=511998 RepID=A0A4Q5KJL4_9GAMM|nr:MULTISPECIES: DNA ligase [Aliivibrio]MDD9173968.1 DNA ligase [Aliivibrio sp. S3TY1]MDD9191045.1 DNA ligase [Aliivibrio sp. S2TY2]RYU46460.1 DNA ligase [Aliivibrio finisterrensis]RYU68795.1 DNA ligase [Aliivibrio finisterrensis]RYU72799.1 DNA ligase [Aliivibrio finisterrensis]
MKKVQLSTLVALGVLSQPVIALDEPNTATIAISLAMNYESSVDIDAYWLSEKLDGIRAYWSGSELLTRKGHKLHAPDWFTDPLPDHPIDGELWAGRGGFQKVARTVLDSEPDEASWRDIRFMMFDLPSSAGMFPKRYYELSTMIKALDIPHLKLVDQHPISSEEMLFDVLEDISARKGEGVMLRRVDAVYRPGRHDDLIKLKKHQDAEAIVIGYTAGKGKYRGMVGALILKMPDGKEFKIGSGLTQALREEPPKLGQQITYRYNGYTDNGIPKFARYLAVREGY